MIVRCAETCSSFFFLEMRLRRIDRILVRATWDSSRVRANSSNTWTRIVADRQNHNPLTV